MPVKLNLMPSGLLISKSLSKVLKTIKAINVILIVTFIVFILGIGVYFILSSISLKNTESKLEQLKSQILLQETSEQQLIILKDRLTKISAAKAFPDALKNLGSVNTILVNLSQDSSISQMDISPSKIDLTMTIRSNADLTNFIKSIEETNLFKSVLLSSFGYSSTGGYNIGVSFVGK
jgi:hypothetical protein